MYSLSSVMQEATSGLQASNGAIAVVSNNVSNVNTAGYTRQVVTLSASALTGSSGTQDNGVSFDGFSSTRDQVLQLSIDQQQSNASSLDAQNTLWSQIQTGFSSTTAGVASSLSTLFSSLSSLSLTPTSGAARQTALSAAQAVVDAFHQASGTLASANATANQNVSDTVGKINALTSQIASLDQQLGATPLQTQGASVLQDQRDTLVSQLSQLAGLTVTKTDTTDSIALSNGTPLVVGNQSFQLGTTRATDGTEHIADTTGQDITASLNGGALGGLLAMRDQQLPQLTSALNSLASQFSSAMNQAQGQGFDATGTAGQPLFALPADSGQAASGIAIALGSASGLALSSDGTAGSTGNLTNLLAVQNTPLPSGSTPTDAYADLVQNIGSAAAQASSGLSVSNTLLSHLTSLQSAASGVSIDEETTNLLRYQQAYSAAAQVISTVNNLFSVLMNMGTAG